MAVDTLLPSGDDGGWPTNGWADIDNTIASPSGVALETTVDNDVVIIDFNKYSYS